MLGRHCCAWAFSSCSEQGLTTLCCSAQASYCGGFSCCRARALGAQASVVVARRLSSCGAQAKMPCGMRDLPGPGLEPVSPALAGGFLTTAPPGKSPGCVSYTVRYVNYISIKLKEKSFLKYLIKTFLYCLTIKMIKFWIYWVTYNIKINFISFFLLFF